ncbi:MAG: KH domain-containing protein [Spirochaetia bacterium]|nr:KH domain-containing protein [Spirochaetota bacterium]MCX8096460.1 KH domain-containing protein [Spirochaetota bacterium]MDW8112736.1 KH domain-containing protein [Spirochaetia bacterium]
MKEKDLVEQIVKSLVDYPEDISLKVVEGEKSTILELKVRSEDIGKIIGKKGRIAKAVRTIVSAVAVKNGRRVILEILD